MAWGQFDGCGSSAPAVVVSRCYVRALKLMPEVPSLWHDLGLNYYQQSRLACVSDGGGNAPSLLLEKAQEVTQKLPPPFRNE